MNQAGGSFALTVIREALLFVDREKFLFANRAFEDLCEETSHGIRQSSSLLMNSQEKSHFFARVRGLMDGQALRNEALVECSSTQTGPFLSKVSFHVYRDESDGVVKCACNFVDPVFYGNLFNATPVPIALLEYIDNEEDYRVFRSNCIISDLVGPPDCRSIDGMALKRELGFEFDLETLAFLRACRPGVPHLKSLLITKSSADSQHALMAVFGFIGYNLRNLPVFSFIASDLSHSALEHEELETCQQLVVSQTAFFAKVMHELRAPISGLMGMASLLRHTALTFEQKDFVKTIEICGDTLFSYTGTILDLTNIEHNNLVLSLEPFSVEQCVEEALAMVSPMACLKKIELLYEIKSPKLSLLLIGDLLRVRQVLLALLSNAVKFTVRDGAHVFVRATVTVDPSGMASVCFAVMDEGIGISLSQQALLFKAFTQANPSVGKKFGGTGLGLAISKSLVELMGGTLTVKSQQDHGSTFQFTLLVEFVVDESYSITTRDVLKEKPVLIDVSDAPLAANLQERLMVFGLNPGCDGRLSVVQGTRVAMLTDREDLARRRGDLSLPTILVGWTRPLHFGGNFLRKPVCTGQLQNAVDNVFGLSNSSLAVEGPATSKLSPVDTDWKIAFRVLIVNDDIVQRKILNRMAEALGFTHTNIRTANDGQEALARLKEQMADLVFMDWNMPVMNGIEATKEIRKRWSSPAKPYIIAVTAAAQPQIQLECLAAGMNDYLQAPLRLAVMGSAIQKAHMHLEQD
jgi:signal transduction histidine kinase/ActR/RegA family two-component response regulator